MFNINIIGNDNIIIKKSNKHQIKSNRDNKKISLFFNLLSYLCK